jgi:GT2 family glycosyltransferase
VLNQSYPNWELCVADDCSKSPEVDAILDRYAGSDPRIKVVRLAENWGISGASNAALQTATGEFIGLLDHDDELPQDALFHVVDALNRRPETDVFYSDEDHIDDEGLRSDPFFKPDWSPDLILGENYVCHFLVVRHSLCAELGGLRSETDLSQDMDLVLRASLKTQRICHIPKVLYHWRTEVYTGDRASDSHAQRALETSRRVVEDYLKAKGSAATVVRGAVSTRWRVRYPIPKQQSVRILVPCGGKLPLLKRCLAGLAEKTDFRAFEVSVIDNSPGSEIADYVAGWSLSGRPATYVDFRNQPFNFSAFNNYAARNVREPLLLFLNDDISMIHGEWLTAMVELASRPEVGAVGAKLLYPDNTIQHAGVVLGIFGLAGHAFKGAFAEDRIYFDFPDLIRNVSAVTGACMMVPTDKFLACGGFDEEAFPVAYNDIDLCLRLGQRGYRILYTPHALLCHHEAASKRARDRDPRSSEAALFHERWKDVIERDPFYSPNLTLDAEDYSYRSLAQ